MEAEFSFQVLNTSPISRARRGRLYTPHGVIETPVFMPVGTQATVKTLSQEEVAQLGFQIILGNTYHLYLRPGDERIARLGGLHRFMRWERAILTDSGGFQVFSLAKLRQIDDDGVTFRSHINGSEHRFTPERAVQIQRNLGGDIMMAFDECPPYPASRDEVAKATERTYRWAVRCRTAWQEQPNQQALFGIIQGGVYDDLRLMSLQQITELDLPGYAIGGVSVGEPVEEMRRVVELVAPRMPADKPRYLMGVGTPTTSYTPSSRAWICSTACCRRALHATTPSSPVRGASTSATPSTKSATSRSTPLATAGCVSGTALRTSTTCSAQARCSPFGWRPTTTWRSTRG
jgi:queuine tRNA-ribosyltransferase